MSKYIEKHLQKATKQIINDMCDAIYGDGRVSWWAEPLPIVKAIRDAYNIPTNENWLKNEQTW